jgi:hypothetical protein
MRVFIPFLLLLLSAGCAKFEFDVVEPADLAIHVGRDQDANIKRDELEYRMRSVEGRLAMHIVNPTDDPIELLGQESFAVDPRGQSHPFRSQSIAPHSYIRVILPPLRPYYRTGPSFGIGIGVSASRYHGRHFRGSYGHFHDPFFDHPTYMTYYDDTDNLFWTWEGETDARIRLTYRRGREVFHHNFLFRRKKV